MYLIVRSIGFILFMLGMANAIYSIYCKNRYQSLLINESMGLADRYVQYFWAARFYDEDDPRVSDESKMYHRRYLLTIRVFFVLFLCAGLFVAVVRFFHLPID